MSNSEIRRAIVAARASWAASAVQTLREGGLPSPASSALRIARGSVVAYSRPHGRLPGAP